MAQNDQRFIARVREAIGGGTTGRSLRELNEAFCHYDHNHTDYVGSWLVSCRFSPEIKTHLYYNYRHSHASYAIFLTPSVALQRVIKLLGSLPSDPEALLWLMAALSLVAQRYRYFDDTRADADALVEKLCNSMGALLGTNALDGALVLDRSAEGIRLVQAVFTLRFRSGVSVFANGVSLDAVQS